MPHPSDSLGNIPLKLELIFAQTGIPYFLANERNPGFAGQPKKRQEVLPFLSSSPK
jgi:hypothetical protein